MRTGKSAPWPTILLIAAGVFAFLVRLLPWNMVFREGQVFFVADDCPYHMRRIMLIIQHFPHVPVFDSYLAYPDGANCHWPPLFDFFIALLAFIAGLGRPSERLVEVLAAFVPPILGVLTLVPTCLLARKIAGQAVGILAAFLLAVLPGFVMYSMLGRVDHHVAEALFFTWTACFLVCVPTSPPGQRAARFVLAGISLAALLLVQSLSIVYAGILFLGVLAYSAAMPEVRAGASFCRGAAITFGLAAALVLPVAAAAPMEASPGTPFQGLSWHQVALLLAAALSLVLLSVLAGFGMWRGWRRIVSLALAGAASIFGLFIACVLFPPVADAMRAGLEFLWKSDLWLQTIGEFSPVFTQIPGVFATPLSRWLFHLLPAGILLWFLLAPPRGTARISSERVFFLTIVLALTLLVLDQVRYISVFAPTMSIVIAYLVIGLPKEIGLQVNPLVRRLAGGAIACGICLCLFVSILGFLARTPADELCPFLSLDVHRGLLWLRTNTPPTSFYADPRQRPEYGVLCDWDKGHALRYLARRPVVVDNLGTTASRSAVEDSTRFMISESEADAVRIAQRRGIRYVVTTPPIRTIGAYCTLGRLNLDQYVAIGKNSSVRLQPHFYGLLLVRLHEGDGCPVRIPDKGKAELTQRLEHFRLIYESPIGKPEANGLCSTRIKIFEFVPGAKLIGKGIPGREVSALTTLKTNAGRRIEYNASVACAPDGSFSIVIPYPTRDAAYPVKAESDFTIACGQLSARAPIPESAVQAGATITVPLPSSPAKVVE